MIIAITGIRDLHLDSHQIVESVIFAYVKAFPDAHFYFGGARGVDTIALIAASEAGALCKVIVPFRVDDQPHEATAAIGKYVLVQNIREMKLPRGRRAYLMRNEALIHPADLVLGFTDVKLEGGTHHAMTLARKQDKTLVGVLVKNKHFDPLEAPR